MTHGELFAGIGGFGLGAEWAGIETLWQVEIDKFCNKVLAKHFPNAKRYKDIKEVTGLERVDIVTGGFPCQEISIAGDRQGLAGKQSGLFWEMARIIDELKPPWFIIENVPGLYSSNNGKDFWAVITTLEKFGYCVCWRLLNAQYFGVAQRRKRVWIIGSLGNTNSVKVLFEQEGSKRNDKKVGTVRQRGLCISSREGEKQDPTADTFIASTIQANDYGKIQHGQFGNEENLIAGSITAKSYGDKGRAPTNEWNSVVAQTIGSTKRGNTSFVWQDTHIAETNPVRKRKIDGISKGLDSDRGKSLGNAIIPQIAYIFFKMIKEIEMNL